MKYVFETKRELFCCECRFREDVYYSTCSLAGVKELEEENTREHFSVRPSWCPLVEVKE